MDIVLIPPASGSCTVTEFAFVFSVIGKTAPKTLLNVGVEAKALPDAIEECGIVVTAIDDIGDYCPPDMPDQFDMVICMCALDHATDHRSAMRGMLRLVRPGGYMVLTCAYTDEYRTCDDPESARRPHYSRTELDQWLLDGSAELVEAQYWSTGDPSADHDHACFLMQRTDGGKWSN